MGSAKALVATRSVPKLLWGILLKISVGKELILFVGLQILVFCGGKGG